MATPFWGVPQNDADQQSLGKPGRKNKPPSGVLPFLCHLAFSWELASCWGLLPKRKKTMRRTSTFGFVWLTPPLPGSCKYHEVPSVEPATNSFVARLTRDHFVNIPYDLTLNSLLLNLCIASLPFLGKLADLHEKPTPIRIGGAPLDKTN